MKKVIITAVMFAVLLFAASMGVSAAETVEWLDLTHNGTDTRLPTQLTITFDKPVTGITADRFSVYNATRGTLTQSEEHTNVYYLEIIDVAQPSYSTSTTISVFIGYMYGYTFTPTSKSITIEMLKYEDWEFWINSNDTVTLTKYTGYDTDVEIPQMIAGLPVTRLESTFRDYKGLKSVVIPYGVSEIGEYAFAYCDNLISAAIPDSVTSIGRSAFSNCGLTSVTIPDAVTYVGDYAFYDCDFISVISMPASATSINSYTFAFCANLTNVTIPNSVLSIEKGAFYYCSKLSEITLPKSIATIGDDAFYNCTKLTTAYFQHSNASTITTFGQNVFYNTAADFKIYYPVDAVGFTTPQWKGYPAYPTDYVTVTGVSLNTNTATLHTGDTITLTAIVTPENATNKTIAWYSSNPSVAVVDADGTVTAVSIGTATITAKTADNRTAVCTITVEMSTPEINDMKLTVQPETKAKRIYEVFGAGTSIADKDGETLNPNDVVGTGSVITLPNGNELTIVVPGDLTGKGKPPQMEDAKIYLEALVGNAVLSDAQESALEDIVAESDSAIKKLRSFLNFVK